jgi:hypothetical protein
MANKSQMDNDNNPNLLNDLTKETGPKDPLQKGVFTPQTLTDDELRSLAIEKLSHALQAIDPLTQPEMTRKLCAEVKDRLDGKPGQQITMDQNLNVVTVNAQISFVKALPLIDAKVIENGE